jgi:hypothetical protein
MRRNLSILALIALASGLATAPARGQFALSPATQQIREDWKLIVASGSPSNDGPQIMTYMSPVGDSSNPYAWFLLNVRDAPNPFAGGGMMIQVWDYSDHLLTSSTSTTATAKLNTANETITWTQRMAWSKPTQITYDIINGSSTTWSTFGSSQGLSSVTFSGPGDLSNYNPQVSASKSRVGWMAGNVTSMTLVAVRQYDGSGSFIRMDTLNLAVNLASQ